MKRFVCIASLALLVVALIGGGVFAAGKPATTHHETLGTEQLKGEYGLMGHTYTLGKSNPWNITLESAEYTTDFVMSGDNIICPTKDEKILLLHFTVHNPQKRTALMRFDTFRVTAVDANNKNWDRDQNLNAEATKTTVNQQFKPAQKMSVYKAVRVPAAGEIPKVIVTGSDNLVIRYDLVGKVKALPDPVADPSDKTGATALAKVPAKMGTPYPAGQFAVSVDGVSYSDAPVGSAKPPTGGRLMVVNMTAKNVSARALPFRFDTFVIKAVDADGVALQWGKDLLAASSDKSLNMPAEAGQEVKFRTFFKVDKGATPAKITVAGGGNARVYEFAVE
jgi:hypothetical protein